MKEFLTAKDVTLDIIGKANNKLFVFKNRLATSFDISLTSKEVTVKISSLLDEFSVEELDKIKNSVELALIASVKNKEIYNNVIALTEMNISVSSENAVQNFLVFSGK